MHSVRAGKHLPIGCLTPIFQLSKTGLPGREVACQGRKATLTLIHASSALRHAGPWCQVRELGLRNWLWEWPVDEGDINQDSVATERGERGLVSPSWGLISLCRGLIWSAGWQQEPVGGGDR